MDYRYEHFNQDFQSLQLIAFQKVCLNKEYSIRSMYQLLYQIGLYQLLYKVILNKHRIYTNNK